MYRRAVPGQAIGFSLISTTTGEGVAGAAALCFRSIDGGPELLAGGVVHDQGRGHYLLIMTAADCDGLVITFLLAAAGCVPHEKTIVTVLGDPTADSLALVNASGLAFSAGQVLALAYPPNGAVLADAADPNRQAIGLATVGALPAAIETIRLAGTLTLADWSAICGSPLLTPGADYYLDVVAGGLTILSPATPGQISQRVGAAATPNTFAVEIAASIML